MQIFKWVPAKVDEQIVLAIDLKQNDSKNSDEIALNVGSILQSTNEISDVSQVENGKSEQLVSASEITDNPSNIPQANSSDEEGILNSVTGEGRKEESNLVPLKNNCMNKENVGQTESCSNPVSSLNLDEIDSQPTVASNAGETSKIVSFDKDETETSAKQEEPVLNELVRVNEEHRELDLPNKNSTEYSETTGAEAAAVKESVKVEKNEIAEKRKFDEDQSSLSNDLPPLKQLRPAELDQKTD